MQWKMEQADRRCKELEEQVTQLQRENDAMRKEMGPFKLKVLWTTKDLRAEQLEDPVIGPICAAKILGQRPPESGYLQSRPSRERSLWLQWEELKYEERVLKRNPLGTGPEVSTDKLLVLPEDCRAVAFQQAHHFDAEMHLSCLATLRRLEQQVYWPGMDEDVACWIQGCERCRVLYPRPVVKSTGRTE
jgi:hypothetical protein